MNGCLKVVRMMMMMIINRDQNHINIDQILIIANEWMFESCYYNDDDDDR